MDFKFSHQISAMVVHRLRAYSQALRDAIVGKSARDGLQYLQFALGKIFVCLGLFYHGLRVAANNAFSISNIAQTRTQFFNTARFEKHTTRASRNSLLKLFRRWRSGDNGKFGAWAPTTCFDQHFQSRCARHDKVKNCAVGRKALYLGDGINSICGGTNDIKTEQCFNGRLGSVKRQNMVIGNEYRRWNCLAPPMRSGRSAQRHSLWIFACLSIFCQISFVHAQDRVLDISGPADRETVGRHLDILLDADHTLTLDDIRGASGEQFTKIVTSVVDAGYTKSMIWLRLKVKNSTSDNADWRLYFNENFKQIFHIYVASENGEVDHVLAQDRDSPFSTRPIAYPEVVAPMVLNRGDSATVYVRYWSEGSTYLPLTIQSAAKFSEMATRSAAKQSIFYGMMMILILAALLASFVIWHPVFPAYIAYSGATLLFLMHVDGVAFQYLWPSYPNFNSYASVVTGGSYAIFGAIYARIFLNTRKHHPIVDKFLVGVVIVLGTMMVSGLFVDPSFIKKYMILVVLFALCLFTVASILAARHRFKQVRFYLVAWLGATASAFLMTLRHWFGIEISQEFQHDSMRMVMIFDAVMMGLAIVDRYSQVRQERQNALHASLTQAQRNLDMSNRLRKLEAGYDLALETNTKHKEHIENTVHDIRQPLHALRLAVQSIMNDQSRDRGNEYGDIYESFDYLERLVSEQLYDPDNEETDTDVSDMQLGDVLGSIHEMFLPDAQERGLSFDYVPTSLSTKIQPLVVMRIVSNLVSNAIKYTPSGKLLLGVRRSHDVLRIEVHDTGAGMSGEEFKLACQRGMRLEAGGSLGEEGKGHGLDIVANLAKRNGYSVELLHRSTQGTSIALTVPAHE